MKELSFGERLADLRSEKRLTQDDVANLLEVDRSAVSSWENSKSYPTVEKLLKLTDFFNVSIDYLMARVPFNVDESILKETFIDNKGKCLSVGEILEIILTIDKPSRMEFLVILDAFINDADGNIGSVVQFYKLLMDKKPIVVMERKD